MQLRISYPQFSAAAFAILLALGVQPARGAIRFTISDGNPADTQVFTSPSNNVGAFSTSIDGIELVANVISSNYPGLASGANLVQAININDLVPSGPGTLPTLTFTAELIDGLGNLLLFTAPSSAILQVTSDVTNVEPIFQSPSGTTQNITTVNGVILPSAVVPINGAAPSNQTLAANTPNGFTMTSVVILTGASIGTSLSIGATSAVVAGPEGAELPVVPEPASLLVVGLGGAALALFAAKRRRTKTSLLR